jgi:ornithine carbamoyltransferase
MEYVQVQPQQEQHVPEENVTHSLVEGMQAANVILTDRWPEGSFDLEYQVTLEKLKFAVPHALVIPCPPFDTTQEIHAEVIASPYFAGYEQKRDLYAVHQAILVYLLA